MIRTDNGPQFIADAFEEACSHYGVDHERIPARTPDKNARIEAFHGILREECLSRYEFETYAGAYEQVASCMGFYNTIQMQSSPGLMASEHYQAIQSKNMKLQCVRV